MDYDLELDKAVEIIKKEKAKLVCIQLVDSLKPKSLEIVKYLESKTDAKIMVWMGSCFGACDIPLELNNLNIDLLIQWGHNKFGFEKIWKKYKIKIKKFCKENSLESPVEHRVLDLISEVEEVAKEILKMSDYGRKPLKIDKEKIKSEIGDAFYSLMTVANSLNIDLEEALNLVIEKYSKRLKKGSTGSEND